VHADKWRGVYQEPAAVQEPAVPADLDQKSGAVSSPAAASGLHEPPCTDILNFGPICYPVSSTCRHEVLALPDSSRFSLRVLRAAESSLAEDVRRGLTAAPKRLPCKYFYDAAGLALYEQITRLPEYYLPRVETDILAHHATGILAHCPPPLTLVELGNGSSIKTRRLIEPCLARQGELTYYAVDLAAEALMQAAGALLRDYAALRFVGLAGEFSDGLDFLARASGPPRLVVFLGSTIGNLDEREIAAFFRAVRRCLRPQDRMLLGFDLRKDPAILVPAYDDAQGVTAAFNLNLLVRVNRELGANFDVTAFQHQAHFNEPRSRIEMHLVSTKAQTVRLRALDLEIGFEAGESIHTENCYKHSWPDMQALLKGQGFRVLAAFFDPRQWFCHVLFT
jgi:L-histidine Nalpha-methyltransferase